MLKSSKKQSRKSDLKEKLDDIFTCSICFGPPDCPKMCPNCSKLFCVICIQKWFSQKNSKGKCPVCRAPIAGKLANLLWINDLVEKKSQERGKTKKYPYHTHVNGIEKVFYFNREPTIVSPILLMQSVVQDSYLRIQTQTNCYNREVSNAQVRVITFKKHLEEIVGDSDDLLPLDNREQLDVILQAKKIDRVPTVASANNE
jgi:tripartite motif-containing protein 37